jgi:Tfp pilus assembly protein PilO
MRRLSRRHLSIHVSLARLVLLLLLAFVLVLMGWFFYVQATGPSILTNA